MTGVLLDTGVKWSGFHFMYLYLTNKQNWFLQVSPQPLGFEGGVLAAPAAPTATTGASVFNLQLILSLSLSLVVTPGTTLPSTALLSPVTGCTHAMPWHTPWAPLKNTVR